MAGTSGKFEQEQFGSEASPDPAERAIQKTNTQGLRRMKKPGGHPDYY